MENNQQNVEQEHIDPQTQGGESQMMNNVEPQEVVEHSMHGVIIGVLIVILVLILGGLYIWGSVLTQEQINSVNVPASEETAPNNEPETARAEADVENLNTVSSSDELEAVEADLENTMLELDQELNEIDAIMEEEPQAQ